MFPPVELLYVTGTENDTVASALQSMWSTTLGVNVMLRGVTQSEYNARMEAGNYELALQKVTALYDDAMGFLDRWCSEDEQNLISYENGTYDVLMGVARASEDPVARTAFLHDAETMLLGETALSPVYFDGTAHMLRDTLRGVYTDGFGNSYFAGVRANTDGRSDRAVRAGPARHSGLRLCKLRPGRGAEHDLRCGDGLYRLFHRQ